MDIKDTADENCHNKELTMVLNQSLATINCDASDLNKGLDGWVVKKITDDKSTLKEETLP